jgi:uncharacterized protein YbjQ (UPF0145 family)
MFFVVVFISCASGSKNTIQYVSGSGREKLDTVSASAVLIENRSTGQISGDTGTYGYVENMPQSNSQTKQQINERKTPLMEKARAIAMYEIIQKAYQLGGNAVTSVMVKEDKHLDIDNNTETVTVTIVADVVKK